MTTQTVTTTLTTKQQRGTGGRFGRKLDMSDIASAPEPEAKPVVAAFKGKGIDLSDADIDWSGGGAPGASSRALAALLNPEPTQAPAQTEDERRERVVADRQAAEAAGFKVAATVFREGQAVITAGVDNAAKSRAAWEKLPALASAAKDLTMTIKSEQREDIETALTTATMAPDGSMPQGEMTEQAFRDFASLAGYGQGASYLWRDCGATLRALNVNAQAPSLDANKRAVLRTRNAPGGGREIFATVSGQSTDEKGTKKGMSYTPIDVDTFLPLLVQAMPESARADVTYQRSQARGLVDVLFHSDVRADDYACGEIFKAGIRLKWDDAGHGAIRVDALIWRNLCLNLIIIDTSVVNLGKVIHIGSLDKKLTQLREAFAKANEAIGHFLTKWGHAKREVVEPAPINVKKSKVLKAENQPVSKAWGECSVNERLEGIVVGLQFVGQLPQFGKADVDGIVKAYWKDEVTSGTTITRAGIVNAISRHAHEGMDRWSGDALERAAGTLTWQTGAPVAFQYAYQIAA